MVNKTQTRREFFEKTIARFWSKVDRCESNECWLWNGSISKPNQCGQRYGVFGLVEHGNNVSYRAHRVAWMLCNGKIPDGYVIMHSCDVPLCVNPSHLKAGTHAENIADRDRKGHTARGANHGMAKLTEIEVRTIKRSNISTQSLADKLNVKYTTIQKIRSGINWKHIH